MQRARQSSGNSRNDALCALLVELNWSVSGFAQRIRERCLVNGTPRAVSTSTVSRWCDNAVPGPDLADPACFVLSAAMRRRISPESLGWPSEEMDVAADALRYEDLRHAVRVLPKLWQLDSVSGRMAVRKMSFGDTHAPVLHQALVMGPDASTQGHGHRRVLEADIELLEAHTDLYGRQDARHGGGRFRGVFAAFLDTHATPLLHGAFSARRGQWLYGSVADAVLALASMAYDDQLPGLAMRYDLQAIRMAQAIGDRGRLARGYIHQARLAAAQDARSDVLTHARSAVFAAASAPALVRAYAAVTEARAWALNDDPEQTLVAVARAREAFERASIGAGPRWLSWLDRPELESQAAWALAMAGLAAPGTHALHAALNMPAERTRDNVELLITGAELARLRGDDSERMVLMKRAVEASRHLKSRRLADRLSRAAEGQQLHDF
ncbi:hypothetical protein Q0Z83_039510 [Actinoplanes sichuanensis]|uniref:Transcriptional regulator n=1 Tax=Actinoplanes sichuanensis TaxID=512349 RepID=A0ABW4A370_9ACTN|nr:hypothetical protein [Actinoplanes sichuanensis]BEL05760.1 hypothetical protein Q0Z83_039510 [Actinoplanes sichuanensis]